MVTQIQRVRILPLPIVNEAHLSLIKLMKKRERGGNRNVLPLEKKREVRGGLSLGNIKKIRILGLST